VHVGAWLRHQVLDDVRISPSLQIQAVTFGDPPTAWRPSNEHNTLQCCMNISFDNRMPSVDDRQQYHNNVAVEIAVRTTGQETCAVCCDGISWVQLLKKCDDAKPQI
jgi:hypothetical protein